MDGRIWVSLCTLSGWVALAAPAQAAVPACDEVAVSIDHRLRTTPTDTAIVGVEAQLERALPHCMTNVALRYLKLRMDELTGAANDRDLRVAMVDFPSDVRIATIWARHTHSRTDATKAVALDSSYAPAQVALAESYFRTDEQKTALFILDHVQNVSQVRGAELLRARALLELGRGREAIDAAMRTRESVDFIEPLRLSDRSRDLALSDTIRGRAHLSLGHRREGVYILVTALAAGDEDAKARLQAELAGEESGATKAALIAIAEGRGNASLGVVAAAASLLQR